MVNGPTHDDINLDRVHQIWKNGSLVSADLCNTRLPFLAWQYLQRGRGCPWVAMANIWSSFCGINGVSCVYATLKDESSNSVMLQGCRDISHRNISNEFPDGASECLDMW